VVCTTADGVPAELYDDDDTAMLRVYTDTLEGEPQTETDVQETEETLPDGTVVRRRITTTRQQQTIVKRVVMEGPEDELPTNEDEAEQLLQQTNLADEDEVVSTSDVLLNTRPWPQGALRPNFYGLGLERLALDLEGPGVGFESCPDSSFGVTITLKALAMAWP